MACENMSTVGHLEGASGRRGRALRRPGFWLRLSILAAVGYYLVIPLLANVETAADRLRALDIRLTVLGFALQVVALLAYSVMTRTALGNEAGTLRLERLFRIQLVTRALASTVPGGAAAGPALGYRLMTAAGLRGAHASASLASASVVSAVALNLMLWTALVVSIPLYGFNALYAMAAVVGVVVMLLVAATLLAIVERSPLIDRAVHFVAERVRFDGDRVVGSLRVFGDQIAALLADRPLMARLSFWAVMNWLLDAASLWVFLRAFGVTMNPIGLLVAFGVANVLAAVPISPGGIGIVEWAYIPILVTFGAGFDQATIAVTTYRIAQLLFPILLGALAYGTLSLESWRRRTATDLIS